MKTKHSWNRDESDDQNKAIHENMKARHTEPPWVACPYCGEKL